MALRLSGLMSGMDTDTIVQELVAVRQTKVDDAKKAQTKLQWKQDAWKSLNSQLMKLYNGAMNNLRFSTSYMKKTTKVSNSSIASVITGDGAMNSVQSLKVSQLAQSGYLTGGRIGDGKTTYKASSTMEELGMKAGTSGSFNVKVGEEETMINVGSDTTISNVISQLQSAGVNASFDEKNQRIYVASKSSGEANDFSILAAGQSGLNALQSLGLSYSDDNVTAYYTDLQTNTAKYVTARQTDALTELSSRKTELTSNISTKVNELWDAYSADLVENSVDLTTYKDSNGKIDTSKMDEAAFESLKAAVTNIYKEKYGDLAAGDEKELNESRYAGLEKWSEELTAMTTELKDVSSKLAVDTDGKTVLTAEHAATIAQAVQKEAAEAKTVLDGLAAGGTTATKNNGSDAKITLNGVEYTSSANTFEINGLTLTVNSTTADGESVTLTTQDDTDGIYDMVKNFLKEYNELINQMDKLYNADSAKGYEPLTSDEKAAMTENEVEEWETKIKDSLLRRDSSLNTVSSAMKEIMMSGVSVGDRTMYLADFGIETLGYFSAADNEKNAYHIDGDADDTSTSGEADKLRAAIANDPESVMNFFMGLSRNLYSKLTDVTGRTEYSSKYSAYDDKKMVEDYNNYTTQIAELEEKLTDYEDKWYAKFSAMETAMAKLQGNASAITSLLGG